MFTDGSRAIIGACIEVHRQLGRGLLESAYQTCLAEELRYRGIPFDEKPTIGLRYRSAKVVKAFEPDFVFEHVVLEVKAVRELHPVHVAQVRTYARVLRKRCGLVINFNVKLLHQGKRTRPLRTSSLPIFQDKKTIP